MILKYLNKETNQHEKKEIILKKNPLIKNRQR